MTCHMVSTLDRHLSGYSGLRQSIRTVLLNPRRNQAGRSEVLILLRRKPNIGKEYFITMALTIKDVANHLDVPIETVHRWIHQGKIPMQQYRGEYVMGRQILEHWADEHKLKVRAPSSASESDNEMEFDGILPSMQRGGVFYDLTGNDKESVLKSIMEWIPNIEPADRSLVFEKLIERERMASTGIGHGIALPHPRSNPGVALALPQITTCFLSRPIPFEAIDNRPVSIIMVLLSSTMKQHLSMLSVLAYHLRNEMFRDLLLAVPERSKLFETIAKMIV